MAMNIKAAALLIVSTVVVLILSSYIITVTRREEVGPLPPPPPPPLAEVEGPSIPVDTAPRGTNEPSIAVSPINPDVMVADTNDYNGPSGDAWVAYYYSEDGGKTWSKGWIPGYPDNPSPSNIRSPLYGFDGTGDPVVAYDKDGNCYIAGIAFQRAPSAPFPKKYSNIWVARSNDGGKTFRWQDISLIVGPSMRTKLNFHDKEWIATNPVNGDVYCVWAAFATRGAVVANMVFSRSEDGGRTWTDLKIISEVTNFQLQNQGSYVEVDDRGRIHVVWIDYGVNQIVYCYSDDRGETFTTPRPIAPVEPLPRTIPGNSYRTPTMPAMAVDRNPESPYYGSVYVVYPTSNSTPESVNGDIMMVFSRDRGSTWSEPTRVNNDSTTADQFFPAVAVSENGLVHVVFYDRRDDPENRLIHLYYALSSDGGVTFPLQFNVTERPFDGNAGGSPGASSAFIGDYIDIDLSGGVAHPVWTDARDGEPTSDGLNADLYTARILYYTGNLTAAGGG